MSYYVFTNPEKERFAREAVKSKGTPIGFRKDPDGEMRLAHCALYNRALEENPKMSSEDLVLYIYRGLGGRVEEYKTQAEAGGRADKLRAIRVKQAQKDAAI